MGKKGQGMPETKEKRLLRRWEEKTLSCLALSLKRFFYTYRRGAPCGLPFSMMYLTKEKTSGINRSFYNIL